MSKSPRTFGPSPGGGVVTWRFTHVVGTTRSGAQVEAGRWSCSGCQTGESNRSPEDAHEHCRSCFENP